MSDTITLSRIEDVPDPDGAVDALEALLVSVGAPKAGFRRSFHLDCDCCGATYEGLRGATIDSLPAIREMAATEGWTHPSPRRDFCAECSEVDQ